MCLGGLLADVGGVQSTHFPRHLIDTDLGNGSWKDLDYVDSHRWVIKRNVQDNKEGKVHAYSYATF